MILKEAARKRVAFFYLSGLWKLSTEKSLSPEKKSCNQVDGISGFFLS